MREWMRAWVRAGGGVRYNEYMNEYHLPVMPKETIEYLNPNEGKAIVDATLGGGGHAQALLEKFKSQSSNFKMIGIDQDGDAIETAKNRLSGYGNIEIVKGNFSAIDKLVALPVDGFLFDLGVSSHQIDAGERGFSMRHDALLDMRMDKSSRLTACDIINEYTGEELAKIFFEYGQERFSKKIAQAIIDIRHSKKIDTTFQLKEIIEKSIPTWKKRESVTRIFQALRIEVNNELDVLKKALASAVLKLKPGGRIVVISYHSLEDRIVKWFFRERAKDGILKVITKKPVLAGKEEVAANPRSKSAKLRCAERI